MPRTNRNTLKEYFKRGSMPNQKHFYELIDSMVNISDDGIDKNPDDGLRLAPSKENSYSRTYKTIFQSGKYT